MIAANINNYKWTECLVEHGAYLNIKDTNDKTASAIAAKKNFIRVLSI